MLRFKNATAHAKPFPQKEDLEILNQASSWNAYSSELTQFEI